MYLATFVLITSSHLVFSLFLFPFYFCCTGFRCTCTYMYLPTHISLIFQYLSLPLHTHAIDSPTPSPPPSSLPPQLPPPPPQAQARTHQCPPPPQATPAQTANSSTRPTSSSPPPAAPGAAGTAPSAAPAAASSSCSTTTSARAGARLYVLAAGRRGWVGHRDRGGRWSWSWSWGWGWGDRLL